MLARVVRRLRDVPGMGPIVVVAATGQNLPILPTDVIVTRDPVSGRGPLQGLAAGLAALPESAELVFATGTDSPFVAPAWAARLAELIGRDELAIPHVEGRHHPLAALYRRSAALPAVGELLAADRPRLLGLLEKVRVRVVDAAELRAVDPDLRTLRNLNTPEDYRAALAEAGFEPPND